MPIESKSAGFGNDEAQLPEFRLDLEDERLWFGNQPVHISQKAFQLLKLFVHNANRLMTKEQILQGVWGERWVSEALVKEYVHDLRVALGDDPRSPRFIETVHGRGYRYLGGIETWLGDARTVTGTRPWSASLVVRPFSDLSETAHSRRLCRGLTDDLITDLARFPDLSVLADAHPMEMTSNGGGDPAPGHTTGADYCLAGSVQATQSHVRVNVRLEETTRGKIIWTEQYDRNLASFLDVQSAIVGHVVSAVGGFSGQISQAERARLSRKLPNSLRAYELYLLNSEAELSFDRTKTLGAFALAKRAVELEPEFARGWLMLGWLCWHVVVEHWAEDVTEFQALQFEAFAKAVELDPLDPFAQMEIASVRALDGDAVGASDALERAIDLGRNQGDMLVLVSSYVAMLLDDAERAMRMMERGIGMILRTTPMHHLAGARVRYFAGDFEGAVRSARLGPDFLVTHVFEILSLAQLAREAEVAERRIALETRHPGLDYPNLSRVLPITGQRAIKVFLNGIAKSGLGEAEAQLRVII